MAWIAPSPSGDSSSAVNPYASFVGWKEDETPADRVEITQQCHPTFWSARQIDKIPERELPRVLQMKGRYKRPGDLMMVQHGMMIVQQPLRDLFEEFEPGIHQFWPLDPVRLKEGGTWPVPCFGMRVRQARRSIVFEDSELKLHPDGGDDPVATKVPYSPLSTFVKKWQITICTEKREGAHLWVDYIIRHHLMLSNELHAAIRDRDLKIWRCHRVKEI